MNDILLIIFIGLTTVAVVLQVIILYGLKKGIEQSSARMESIANKIEQRSEPVLSVAHAILEDAQPKISEITSNLAETTATVRSHASEMAAATAEILERARVQAARLDDLVNSTANKVEETTDYIQHTVVTPVRRIHAVVTALNAGLKFLKHSRAQKKAEALAKAEADEEMFI